MTYSILKILFIHGLASSGAYKTVTSLHHLLRPCDVFAPDVPIDPDDALRLLEGIVSSEHPDLIVGLSLGGFWAQQLHGCRKVLINPGFHASELMRTMKGEVRYLSPRKNGDTSFTITEELCRRYEELESGQFDSVSPEDIWMTCGMFADRDEMVDCYAEFEEHYPGKGIRYPGTHLPTHPELKQYLLPLIRARFPEILHDFEG